MERKVLGRGLDALIPKREICITEEKEFTYLPLTKIKQGKYQPRQNFDAKEMQELTQSIKEKGFIQPVVVRKTGNDSFEVVAGGRRFEAAKLLGLNEIPALIKNIDDKDTLVFAIVENLQRKELNPMEEAEAFKRLIDEFQYTLEDVARQVAKDKTTVVNSLRLLKLPLEIQEAVRKGIINKSQARTILGTDQREEQEQLFHQILKEGLTVREIEKRTRKGDTKKKKIDPFVIDTEREMQERLGTKVRINNQKNNKGKIIIEYYSLADLERIIRRVG